MLTFSGTASAEPDAKSYPDISDDKQVFQYVKPQSHELYSLLYINILHVLCTGVEIRLGAALAIHAICHFKNAPASVRFNHLGDMYLCILKKFDNFLAKIH